jgi:hypothetical protein
MGSASDNAMEMMKKERKKRKKKGGKQKNPLLRLERSQDQVLGSLTSHQCAHVSI